MQCYQLQLQRAQTHENFNSCLLCELARVLCVLFINTLSLRVHGDAEPRERQRERERANSICARFLNTFAPRALN